MENRHTNRGAYQNPNVREHHHSAAQARAHRGREAQTRGGRKSDARAILEVIKYIAGLACAAAGFFLIVGTAGASDLELIAISQILKQGAAGLALLAVGFLCCRDLLESEF